MSAPDTNVKKQEKEHRTPLLGMGAVVAFAGALLVLLVGYVVLTGNEPGEADATVDGRTGAIEVTE